MRTSLLVPLLALACSPPYTPPPADPVFTIAQVSMAESGAVASADCPSPSHIVGGGCRCRTVGDVLFGAAPAGESYVCGCYSADYTRTSEVEAWAVCLRSNEAAVVRSGLTERSPEAEALLQDFARQAQERVTR